MRSCLVITVLAIGLFIAGIIYMMRMPGLEAYGVCKTNLPEIVAAIKRYEDVEGHRPATLDILKKEYLQDPKVLRCPLDETPGNGSSYYYNPKAGAKQLMLQCNRHRFRKDFPINRLSYSGDGSDISLREMLNDAQKEAEKQKHGSSK